MVSMMTCFSLSYSTMKAPVEMKDLKVPMLLLIMLTSIGLRLSLQLNIPAFGMKSTSHNGLNPCEKM
jgi:hypothetical protein